MAYILDYLAEMLLIRIFLFSAYSLVAPQPPSSIPSESANFLLHVCF